MNALRERLASLTARERTTLGVGAAGALALMLYALVWQPWQSELERLREQVPAKAQDLAWMQERAAQAERLMQDGERSQTGSGLPLLTLLERSANRVEIRDSITRMSPGEDPEQVRIWLDDAAFDQWLRWLSTLQASGVVVAEASIDGAGSNRVNVRAMLQR